MHTQMHTQQKHQSQVTKQSAAVASQRVASNWEQRTSSKLHIGNVQTGARVFIGISLHLSIEKSFAIKSDFNNVNKYIVIVNEHFII